MIRIFKTFYLHLKNKLTTSLLFIKSKLFNISSFNKVIITFTRGLVYRICKSYFYNINVFTDYFHYISISYYCLFYLSTVLVHGIVDYFNINIIPPFITYFYFDLVNLYNHNMKILTLIYNNLKSLFYTINTLKWEDLKPSSIRRYIILATTMLFCIVLVKIFF